MSANQEFEIMDNLFDQLYPLCRSITGEGIRESLEYLKAYMPLEIKKFYSNKKVLNWTIPQEWIIREAWIKDLNGNDIINFKDNNLHVISYSDAVNKKISLKDLKSHIYTSKTLTNAIPYVTAYYNRRWGFCMSEEQLRQLHDQEYQVYIDSEFVDGSLDIGHTFLEGIKKEEVLLSAYLCHPSMANNELSGPIVLAMLYNRIKKWKQRNLTYRFVINPETIGSIAYLSQYGLELKKTLYSGLVFTCLGGEETLRYKTSRREDSAINYMMRHLVQMQEVSCRIWGFTPTNGSDERQYCSPGFNLPVGQIGRLTYGEYPEYHTSLDNKELMGIENLQKSIEDIEKILYALDNDGYYINKYPYGEIKLGDYDLYPKVNNRNNKGYSTEGLLDGRELLNSILMVLNYSDGEHKLSEIAEKLGYSVLKLIQVVELLKEKELLEGPYFQKGEKTI